MHILVAGAPSLDKPHVARCAELLDIVEGRLVEIDDLKEVEQSFVKVENRHVTTEAARKVGRRDPRLTHRLPSFSRYPLRSVADRNGASRGDRIQPLDDDAPRRT